MEAVEEGPAVGFDVGVDMIDVRRCVDGVVGEEVEDDVE